MSVSVFFTALMAGLETLPSGTGEQWPGICPPIYSSAELPCDWGIVANVNFFGVFRSIVCLMPRCSSEPTAGWSVEGTGREVT